MDDVPQLKEEENQRQLGIAASRRRAKPQQVEVPRRTWSEVELQDLREAHIELWRLSTGRSEQCEFIHNLIIYNAVFSHLDTEHQLRFNAAEKRLDEPWCMDYRLQRKERADTWLFYLAWAAISGHKGEEIITMEEVQSQVFGGQTDEIVKEAWVMARKMKKCFEREEALFEAKAPQRFTFTAGAASGSAIPFPTFPWPPFPPLPNPEH